MRQIEFRGKRKEDGKWVYGYLVKVRELICYILPGSSRFYYSNKTAIMVFDKYEVEPKTVGQFSGYIDTKGNKVYEGDLLLIPHNDYIREGIHVVHYYEGRFMTSSILFKDFDTANKNNLDWILDRGATVIGNIHESTLNETV